MDLVRRAVTTYLSTLYPTDKDFLKFTHGKSLSCLFACTEQENLIEISATNMIRLSDCLIMRVSGSLPIYKADGTGN